MIMLQPEEHLQQNSRMRWQPAAAREIISQSAAIRVTGWIVVMSEAQSNGGIKGKLFGEGSSATPDFTAPTVPCNRSPRGSVWNGVSFHDTSAPIVLGDYELLDR